MSPQRAPPAQPDGRRDCRPAEHANPRRSNARCRKAALRWMSAGYVRNVAKPQQLQILGKVALRGLLDVRSQRARVCLCETDERGRSSCHACAKARSVAI